MLKYLLILLWLPIAGLAQTTDYGRVALLRGWQLEDGSYQAALAFSLNPGWKTYWRAPGPAGLPPRFDWQGSSNLGDVQIDWPVPKVINQSGMMTLGYSDHFVLPIRFTPAENGPVRLALNLHFGVCSDICVPAQATFLSQLNGEHSEGVGVIRAALANAPVPGGHAGLEQIRCSVIDTAKGLLINADMTFGSAVEHDLTVIESGDDDVWIDMPNSETDGAHIFAQARLSYLGRADSGLDQDKLVISVFGGGRAIEIHGCPD